MDPVFDPSPYPRTYEVFGTKRPFYIFFGLLVFGGGIAGAWFLATDTQSKAPALSYALSAFMFGLGVLGIYLVAAVFKERLILRKDSIIYIGTISSRELRRENISHFRLYGVQGMLALEVHPTGKTGKIKTGLFFNPDSSFINWFAGLKNPDVEAFERDVASVVNDEELGNTRQARVDNLVQSQKTARVLYWVSIFVICWLIFLPKPYLLALFIAAILPILAILLRRFSNGAYAIDDGVNSIRGDLATPIFVPAAALELRALLDVHLTDPLQLLPWTVCGGTLVLLFLAWAAPEVVKRKTQLVLFALFFCAPYAAAVTAIWNKQLDRGAYSITATEVLSKRLTSGKRGRALLILQSSDSADGQIEIVVPGQLYIATEPHDKVCLMQFNGALGLRWQEVRTLVECGN